MRNIQAGSHAGHILTEFATVEGHNEEDHTLLRKFREKLEAAARYVHLRFKAGV